MKLIAIDSILIPPTRQRQEFDPAALMELTTSIDTNGLLQALVLRQTSDGLVLVAGERRLRAIKDLWMLGLRLIYNEEIIPEGQIPYTTLGDLGELEAEEAELDENLKRMDLTWQELASAHERLHKLRGKQHSISNPVSSISSPWTIADTAKELTGRSDGAYQDNIRKELIVANNLSDGEVQGAKSVDEAFKILKRKENTANNLALAKEVGITFSASTHELYNIDCIAWMSAYIGGIEAENLSPKIDVILTDPPYGINADQFGNAAGKLNNIEHHYDDSPQAWRELMALWCPMSYKITKAQAHAYIFCDIDRFHELKDMMKKAGWYVFRTPFIRIKPNSGRVPLPDQGPRRQWECLLYAIKGKKPITHIYPDVITSNADKQLYHGAQKPVELFKNLLQRSVKPGDTVIDCFAGTGTIIPAAHAFQCKAIALEQDSVSYANCIKRVQELKGA